MKQILRWTVGLVGVLFVAAGLRWLVDPAGAAATLGMPLLTGVGLSSQIGDMAAFFITLGSTVVVAALTRRRLWFYPPMLLLGTAAVARTLAWAVHGASLVISLMAVELATVAFLWYASWRLAEGD
jgi:hypothetical protein